MSDFQLRSLRELRSA